VQIKVKMQNREEFGLQALVNPGCTHTRIDKQLVKKERIQTKSMDRLLKIFNADGTKNGEVT